MSGSDATTSISNVLPTARRDDASSPRPARMEEMTAPPMPIPVPTANTNCTSGNDTLMPASPASPTTLPTNSPSTMP